MDVETIADSVGQKIKNLIIVEIKEELKEFKAEVRGELSGFRIAIEQLSKRVENIEHELRDVRVELKSINKKIDDTKDFLLSKIDETNKRIENTNNFLLSKIDETNKRIDNLNIRIDYLYEPLTKMREDLKKAIADKERIDDLTIRIQRVEAKVA